MARARTPALRRAQAAWRGFDPGRADAFVAVAIAVAAVVLLMLTPVGGDVTRAADLPGVLLVSATALPLAWRRTAPVWALLGCLVASVAAVAAGYGAAGVQFTLPFALASAAAHTDRRTTSWLAGLGSVCALAALVAVEGSSTTLVDGVALAAVVIVPLLVGDLLRTERERAAAVREQLARGERLRAAELESAAAAERVSIARDVHDIVGHHLSAIAVQAHAGRVALAADPDQTDRSLRTVADLAAEALTEVRRALGGLRAAAETVPQPGIAQLPQLLDAARRDGLDVAQRVEGVPRPASPLAEASVYRIVQEALTNVRRHGSGGARVTLRFEADALALDVANACDGVAGPDRGSNGIAGMRERASLVGGRLEAGADARGEWHVRATVPLDGPSGP